MTQTTDAGQEAEAVLFGSLALFPLPHVLGLAAAARSHGRLTVTAPGVDGHLWLEDGELTGFSAGNATTVTESVFDLALVADGWFSFVPGVEAPSVSGRRSVRDVLAEVEPQVAEWHELVARVSLDGLVRLCPTAPDAEVQIRADQWKVLTAVSPGGSPVRDLISTMGSQYVVALRLVRELLDAGLIETVGTEAGRGSETPSAAASGDIPGASFVPPRTDGARAATAQAVPASEVEVLPPPAGTYEWAAPPISQEPVASRNGWNE